jgi:hypothetical protein
MQKFKSVFTTAELSDIKEEVNKSIIEVSKTNFEELDDELAYKTLGNGARLPYIISSIEDKLSSTIIVLEDSVEQLKAIRNIDGLSDFIDLRCDEIKTKVKEIQSYYKVRTHAEVSHRFKVLEMTNKKGMTYSLEIEASTKEQQVRVRSTIQKKILKILVGIDLLLQEVEKRNLKGGGDVPERMTITTESRKCNVR